MLFEDSVERNRQRRMQKGGEAGKVAMESTTCDGIGEQVTIYIIHNLRGLL